MSHVQCCTFNAGGLKWADASDNNSRIQLDISIADNAS